MGEFDRPIMQKNAAKEKKKKILLVGIVICIITIIVLAVMIMLYQNEDARTFKLYVNNVQFPNITDGFYITTTENETYVRARDIAYLIGWQYQNGEYGTYTEDTNSGYIQNGYEVSSFVAGSNILKKYIEVTVKNTDPNGVFQTNSENGTLETFTLAAPVISQNGQIYFPLRCLPEICDATYTYSDPFRMYIFNQEYLIAVARQNAAAYGYTQISGIYENMRLLPYGRMVVKKGDNYGVVDLWRGGEYIGFKYTDMIFAQNVKEFFVKTYAAGEESIGIINIEGKQVVEPKKYSNIQILSDDLGLYLVEKGGEYGVLNREGEVIVHCEYDNIGIPEDIWETFEFTIEDNKYLIFDDTIIVEADKKYGLFDTNGEQTLQAAYLGFGYIAADDKDAVKNAEDVLTIEINDLKLSDGNGTTRNVRAIIVKQPVDGATKYGVYDAESKKLILPCIYDRIYSMTSRGNTEYYIEFRGQTAKFSDQLANNPTIFEKSENN